MDPEPRAVLVETTEEGITTIILSRPKRTNAVDTPTARKLYEAILAFENDSTQKVCILHGDHGNFCAGFDLTTISEPGSAAADTQPANPVQGRNIGPMGPSRLQVKKPLICAVAGYAVAGGLELSLLGDIRIAEEGATFGVFCRRFGVPLIDGGTVRLQAVVGFGRAMDMILTGRGVSTEEALQMGLANYVAPKGKSLEKAREIARQLVGFPQLCMNTDRRSAYYAAYEARSLEDALGFEYEHGSEVITKESQEGARRFRSGVGKHGSFKGDGKL